jgi:hypothetical protein
MNALFPALLVDLALDGWVMLTGSEPAIDSSRPCSSFRSAASSGFSCAGVCFVRIAATLFGRGMLRHSPSR